MRDDVKNLLQEIGQPDFPYRDYNGVQHDDRYGYWPLFEAIALHPSIARRGWSRGRQMPQPDRRQHSDNIFGAYDMPAAADAPAAPPGGDIRSLLRRLSGDAQ